jgi:antitoxin component of MazEF toxin-antitoxin module
VQELCKLVRNGNSTHVALTKRVLEFLGWRCGDPVVVEVCVDRTVRVRRPTMDDLRVGPAPGRAYGAVEESPR